MFEIISCRGTCGNDAVPLPGPDWPPPWGGGGGTTPPIDPTIVAVTCPTIPATAVAGAAALLVRVMGQNFTAGCQVLLDGAGQATTFVNTSELNFTLTPGAAATTHTIQVDCAGAIATGTCQFTITAAVVVTPTPTLSYVSPDLVGYYDGGKVITYTGTDFDATSTIIRGAIGAIPTTFVNSTTLTTTNDPALATTATFEMRVRNGTDISNYKFSNNLQATCIWNPGLNMLNITTAPIADGPITVELLGTNFSIEPTAMIAGTQTALPTVKRSGGWLDVTLTPPGAPGIIELDARIGHDHPEGHDDVRPSALNTAYPGALTLPFTWT